MCSHLYRASKLFNFQPYNEAPTKFVHKVKPGRKAGCKTFKLSEEQPKEHPHECQSQTNEKPNLNEDSRPLTRKRARDLGDAVEFHEAVQITKKQITTKPIVGRGRPRKSSKALQY